MTLIHLPGAGSWSMSPSRICDSETFSIACSELIVLPDCCGGKRPRSGDRPGDHLRILRLTVPVNDGFPGLPSRGAITRRERRARQTLQLVGGWGDDVPAENSRRFRSLGPLRL